MKERMKQDIQIILLDLGGVLIELGDSPFPREWLRHGESFELSDWFRSETALRFERGDISSIEFAQTMQSELNLSATVEDIVSEFTLWPQGFYPGIEELLDALSQSYSLAVLTNTNELHWPRIRDEFNLARHSNHIFASHLIKMAKPQVESFEYVLKSLNVAPRNVLFFDDNPLNTAAANQIGIQAHTVYGQGALRQKVKALGLLD